jgi:hypothetical protein
MEWSKGTHKYYNIITEKGTKRTTERNGMEVEGRKRRNHERK